jgi:protease-4
MKWPWKRKKPTVAIIRIEGVISDSRESRSGRARILQGLKIAENLDACGVILRINSPGGTVGASQEIYDAVCALRDKSTPIVASFGDVAASGGLYVALGASRIVSNPGTITGSIGVIMQSPELSALYQKVGVATQVVKSGPFKDILSTARPLSDAERALLQGLIDDSYAQFVEAVADGRKLPIEEVKKFADGRILTGRQAKELGLVDELGGMQLARKRIQELANLDDEPEFFSSEVEKNWREKLLGPFARIGAEWEIKADLRGVPLWLMPR